MSRLPAQRRRSPVAAPSEHHEQSLVCEWWRYACKGYGLPEFSLFSVPNGAHLAGDARGRAIKMANLKRTGLRPGVPDLCLAVPRLDIGAGALYVEMKRKPNKPSEDQEKVILYLRQRGYHCVIAWSVGEAIKAITEYLHNP